MGLGKLPLSRKVLRATGLEVDEVDVGTEVVEVDEVDVGTDVEVEVVAPIVVLTAVSNETVGMGNEEEFLFSAVD